MAEPLLYPQAYLAQGNGDLVEVTDFSVNLTNGAKQHHTMRKPGAGIVFTPDECTVSFNSALSEDGAERNYWSDAQKKKIKQLRAKLPGGTTLTINGSYKDVNLDAPIDAATKVACTFVGVLEPVD